MDEFDWFEAEFESDKPPLTLLDMDTSHVTQDEKEACPVYQRKRSALQKRKRDELEWSMQDTICI